MPHGEKVGLLKVRLYRPFCVKSFMEALPATVRQIAVLDRTKESGAIGEPLYLDVVNALHEGEACSSGRTRPGRGRSPRGRRTLRPLLQRIHPGDGQGRLRQPEEARTRKITSPSASTTTSPTPASTTMPTFSTEPDSVVRALFYGLGADGTVGANKNSIKIIGENTDNYAQGYFVYDSKKSGAMTVSHLRFGPQPINSSYLVSKANFVACHQWIFLERYDMLSALVEGGVFLLNSPFGQDEVWDHLPREVQ